MSSILAHRAYNSSHSSRLCEFKEALLRVNALSCAVLICSVSLGGLTACSAPTDTAENNSADVRAVTVDSKLVDSKAVDHSATSSQARTPVELATANPNRGCNNQAVLRAYAEKASDRQVKLCGQVKKTLADDNKGSRHQRFIVQFADGQGRVVEQTILIAHNIDLAPYVPLAQGDEVVVFGEYEFNPQGGVVHWTHHDPAARHQDGYIWYQGKFYQ